MGRISGGALIQTIVHRETSTGSILTPRSRRRRGRGDSNIVYRLPPTGRRSYRWLSWGAMRLTRMRGGPLA